MKKVLAIFLAAVMVLSLSVPAFAQITVNGTAYPVDAKIIQVPYAKYVSANAAGDQLKVTGDVNGEYGNNSISASEGAEIIVTGTVTNNIEDSGYSAVSASSGATVTTGNVIAGNGNLAIYASGIETTVTAKGVEESGNAFAAIYAEKGAKVNIDEDVIEHDAGDAINAEGSGTTVKVGGNVDSEGGSYTIDASNGAVVIVEGLVAYDITSNKTNSGTIYLGQLGRNISGSADNIHYLIGTADGSESFDSLIVTGDTQILSENTIDGVKKSNYHYTTTADSNTLSGKQFTLKSSDSKKKLIVKGIAADADVSLVPNTDGTVTLTLGSNFKGGLQDLMLIFEDIIVKNSKGGGSTKTLFTGTSGNPVTNGKWTKNADGTWSYASAYKFSNTWGYIANPDDASSAAWYYFDRNGNMLTGWQLLTWNGVKKWFYFIEAKGADEGKCLMNGTTPDGYRVGVDGAWIEG